MGFMVEDFGLANQSGTRSSSFPLHSPFRGQRVVRANPTVPSWE